MDRYEITVDAELGPRRCRDLGCERVDSGLPGVCLLRTPPLDQAGLFGLLRRLRDAGIGLVAVTRIATPSQGDLP